MIRCLFIIILIQLSLNLVAQDLDLKQSLSCKNNFDPVCGMDGNTFANACFAEVAGIEVANLGVCEDPSLSCPTDYNPVCGIDQKTYENACLATTAGVEIISSSACDGDNACKNNFDPVCGMDGQTYKNRCEANLSNMLVQSSGACDVNSCPEIIAPVCASNVT